MLAEYGNGAVPRSQHVHAILEGVGVVILIEHHEGLALSSGEASKIDVGGWNKLTSREQPVSILVLGGEEAREPVHVVTTKHEAYCNAGRRLDIEIDGTNDQ